MKSKNVRLKKVFSMILCGILLVMSMTFSDLGSVKAHAAEPTEPLDSTVKVEISALPVSHESTELSGLELTVPPNCHYTARIDDRAAEDGGERYWYNDTTWKKTDEQFRGGDTYRLAVIITADDGYYYSVNKVGYDITNVVTNSGGTGVYNRILGRYGATGFDDGYDKVKSFLVYLKYECEPLPYEVTFNKGEGDDTAELNKMPSVSKPEGDYYLPGCGFLPPVNKKFAGWAVGDAGTRPLKQPGEKIDLRENTTLYAIYELDLPKKYELNVNYDTNCGTVLVNVNGGREDYSGQFERGTSLNLIPMPKSGWQVVGWTFDPSTSVYYYGENGDRVNFNMPSYALTATLTFKKDPAAKTVTLNPQGGSVETSEIMTNKEGYLFNPNGTLIDLPTPSKSGATFKWWSTSPDGTEYDKYAKYTDGATLYAVYDNSTGPDPDPDSDPDDDEDGHDHNFEWQIISEPSMNCDGVEAEVCSCGAIRETRGISAYAYVLNQYADALIKNAKPGQTITFEFGEWNSFPKSFMEKIAARRDVTFVFHYNWKHVRQEIIIPAGKTVDTKLDWYGPAKMAELY